MMVIANVNQTDFTAGKGFNAMLEDFKMRNQAVYWLRPRPEVQHTIGSLTGREMMVIANVEQLVSPPDEEEASDIPVAVRHNAALMEDEETPPGSPVTVSINSPSDSNVVVVTVA